MVACRKEGSAMTRKVHTKKRGDGVIPPLVSSFSLALSFCSFTGCRNTGAGTRRSISVLRRRQRQTLLSPCPLCLHAPSYFARRSRNRAAIWLAVADGGAPWDPVGTRVPAVGVPDDRRSGTDRRWRWNVPRRGGYESLLIGEDRASASRRRYGMS